MLDFISSKAELLDTNIFELWMSGDNKDVYLSVCYVAELIFDKNDKMRTVDNVSATCLRTCSSQIVDEIFRCTTQSK